MIECFNGVEIVHNLIIGHRRGRAFVDKSNFIDKLIHALKNVKVNQPVRSELGSSSVKDNAAKIFLTIY